MEARATLARRGRASIAILCVVAALLTTLSGGLTSPAGAQGDDRLELWSSIDLVESRDGRGRVVGWVASTGGRAPAIRVVVDGRSAPELRPTSRRFDVARVLPGAGGAWGWELQLDREIRSSVCVSAVVDDVALGLDCWSSNDGVLRRALGAGARIGTSGPLIRYSIETEAATDVHPEDLARSVDAVLADPRSWAAHGDARFERVKPERADLRIVLATPRTTDRMCLPFRTGGRLSCNRFDELIVFNINRWTDAVPHWSAPLAEYRSYLVNHEIGHSLDFRHVGCPRPGMPAPLMMQQTKGLGGCLPNGWPYASGPTCLGKPATIVAVPGKPTVGTNGDDIIVGTPKADDIRGGPGDDVICGLGGADLIRGNGGDDVLRGGSGPDQLWGGKGRDTLWGNRGDDALWGNSAADTLRGGSGADNCEGGSGADDTRGC